ncbi:right-handed parallel beta-helix repeat-containing protein [Tahibacter harae]|uniref:Right-handed parallel beta-helix repeat-containing protein n=1 Tax=Tahibacter harae TaxID=2963937 RepID=A0ABT1QTW2_9GAMM|nr:right-handed parallel beta-helix repeat-containing protein [Tahibacter harae]MCQ4165711.1 right-handed parallel beta-helix repeat-containing protein [Tahibacter harae]
MTLLRFLARLGLGGAALASSAFAADYEVNQTGDSGSGSLRSALALANANPGADRILIHSAGPIVLSSGPVPVTDSVEILGTGAEPAVLAGNGLGRLLLIEGDGNEACRVDVRLARLHLRDGYFDGDGGAVHASYARLRVEDSRFSQNRAGGWGGAIFIDDCELSLVSSQFDSNISYKLGGAVAVSEARLVARRSRFSGNEAEFGGAISVHGVTASAELGDSYLYGNRAQYSGGGLLASATSLHIAGSTFADNQATTSDGGALHLTTPLEGAISVIENTTFNANRAPEDSASGGAVFLGHGRLILRNSTVVGNSTGPASGAFTSGGGVFVGGDASRLDLVSSIVAGNTQGPAATPRDLVREIDPDLTPATVSARRSLVQALPDVSTVNGEDFENRWQLDPQLEPLRDNGGPTPTMALTLGSPACERGENDAGLATDQRGAGFARGYGRTDIGAYEYRGDTIFYGDFELHDPGEFGCARLPAEQFR